MPYKSKKEHNDRRKTKRRLEILESIKKCKECGCDGYLLIENLDQVSLYHLKNVTALCLNCLVKRGY